MTLAILRRIRGLAAGHNWFATAVDLAILVLGVFLGLQANSWNEDRLDRERGRRYRDRLVAELASTERSMQASRAYYSDMRGHVLAALNAFDRPPGTLGTPFLYDLYEGTQIFPRAAKHATWDEILAAGKAELAGSQELRQRIANFYWRMDGLMTLVAEPLPYRTLVRSNLPYPVQVAIRASCDEIVTMGPDGMTAARLPPACPVALDPAEVRAGVQRMRGLEELRPQLTRVAADLDVKLQQFSKLEISARELRGRVARAR